MVEWIVEVKTPKPKMSIGIFSCVCNDNGPCMAHHHFSNDEHEDDSDNNYGPSTIYAKVEASQKDIQHGKDKGTAAAQTQMPSTKPKASILVAGRRLIDGNEVTSLKDQSPLPLLTLKGTVSLANVDPKRTASVHASIIGKTSELQDIAIIQLTSSRMLSDINKEETKKQYYKDLCNQVKERKQQIEKEKRINTNDELKHNETMQHSIWGMPGSGAPNYHLGTARRTRSLQTAGILPQEQFNDNSLSGLFHRL